jgi:multisubunit Na+/H+ antiporter MnhC subunit
MRLLGPVVLAMVLAAVVAGFVDPDSSGRRVTLLVGCHPPNREDCVIPTADIGPRLTADDIPGALLLAAAAVLLTALVVALVRIIRALIKTPAQQR